MSAVGRWLEDLGLGRYAGLFAENELDLDVLTELTEADLIGLGIPLGHRKKLLRAIAQLEIARSPDGEFHGEVRDQPAGQLDSEPVGAERRHLTVVFCDLVGSTALSRRLDPEDLHAIVRAYQDSVAGVVARMEGFVARYMGDGVLIYFGFPRAHEDDAERAVRASLEVIETVGALRTKSDVALESRVGIATGLVVVGDMVGVGTAQEIAATGETPNIAARLQGLAEPDTLVVDRTTHRLVSGLFDTRDLGKFDLKGIPEPTRAWRVIKERSLESRFEATRSGRLLPFVNREQEISTLLDRWAAAKRGEGQLVLVSGEAGIGKSRLVQAFETMLSTEAHTKLRFFASPYHGSSALYPFVEYVRRSAKLGPNDDATKKSKKIASFFSKSIRDTGEAVALFGPLLSASAMDPEGQPSGPRATKERMFDVLLEQVIGLSRQKLLLIVVEDLHWIDPTSLELLDRIAERVRSLRLLVIVSYRSDFTPGLQRHDQATLLPLSRLRRSHCEAMIEHLANRKAIPGKLLSAILARTDGVALFVEELTKAVLESEIVSDKGDRYELTLEAPALAIPTTLNGSLMARLDRHPGAREIAQTGSVVGREFSLEMLAAVSRLPESKLTTALDRLVEADLLKRKGAGPRASYRFKHALVQDAAYESLLISKRQDFHARIAQVLEQRFPDVVATEPALLAHHHTRGGSPAAAVEYRLRAGRLATSRSAMEEAITELNKGLELLADLPQGAETRRWGLELQVGLGTALRAARAPSAPETGRTWQRARELCLDERDAPQLLQVLYGQFLFHQGNADLSSARKLGEQLLAFGDRYGNESALLRGHSAVGRTAFGQGDLAAARIHLDKALSFHERGVPQASSTIEGPESPVLDLCYRAWTLFVSGEIEEARACCERSIAVARGLAQSYDLVVAQGNACYFYQFDRNLKAVADSADAVIALAGEKGFPAWLSLGKIFCGWALVQNGRADEGILMIELALDEHTATGEKLEVPYFMGLLAECFGALGRPDKGLELIDRAVDLVEQTGERWFEAEFYRLRGELTIAASPEAYESAEICFEKALKVAREQRAKLWELQAGLSLARHLIARGSQARAQALLEPIAASFKSGSAVAALSAARALLQSGAAVSKL
jgi:class 3 adenylate cyclase/predicted ATPase